MPPQANRTWVFSLPFNLNDILKIGRLDTKFAGILSAEASLDKYDTDVQGEEDQDIRHDHEMRIRRFRGQIENLRRAAQLPLSIFKTNQILSDVLDHSQKVQGSKEDFVEESNQARAARELEDEGQRLEKHAAAIRIMVNEVDDALAQARIIEENDLKDIDDQLKHFELDNEFDISSYTSMSLRPPAEALASDLDVDTSPLYFAGPDLATADAGSLPNTHITIRENVYGVLPGGVSLPGRATALCGILWYRAFEEYISQKEAVLVDSTSIEATKPRDPLEPAYSDEEPIFNSAKLPWQRLENYPLGEGGYGKVYLARYKVKPDDPRYKFMAVKKFDKARLDPAHVTSFEDEVASLRRLRHPNIVRYLGARTSAAGHRFIFLEYVSGGSVAQLIKALKLNGKALSEVGSKVILGYVLAALKYLHSPENGSIVHRDIKGANILIDLLGNVKVADFGTAICLRDISPLPKDSEYSDTSDEYPFSGTLQWSSPEAVAGGKYTTKTDIWSVGCLLAEMLSGNAPHSQVPAYPQAALQYHIMKESPPLFPKTVSQETRKFLLEKVFVNQDRRLTADAWLSNPWMIWRKEDSEGPVSLTNA